MVNHYWEVVGSDRGIEMSDHHIGGKWKLCTTGQFLGNISDSEGRSICNMDWNGSSFHAVELAALSRIITAYPEFYAAVKEYQEAVNEYYEGVGIGLRSKSVPRIGSPKYERYKNAVVNLNSFLEAMKGVL